MKMILFCISLLSVLFTSTVTSLNITIIHNNDIHARFVATNVYGEDCENESNEQCFGGIAKVVYKANELRTKIPNLLFLNSGDNYVGTLWYSLFKWSLVAELVKKMKFDAMSLGNHEFDDGVEGLEPYVRETSNIIPTLACNLEISQEPQFQSIVHKSKVFAIEGRRVAVIGYITPETAHISSPGPTLKFTDEAQCIQQEINVLKKRGVNIFIALGHSGFEEDLKIAEKVPDLDIVVGGHSNTFLWSGEPPSFEKPVNDYPVVVKHNDSSITLVVQAFAFSKYLGFLNVIFDEKGNIEHFSGKPILLDYTIPADKEIQAMLSPKAAEIKSNYDLPIGNTVVMLNSDCRRNECNLGNLITDAMIFAALKSSKHKSKNGWSEYPAAFITSGGIRASIDETAKQGNITVRDILRVLPFHNEIVGLRIPGSILKDVFEHSVFRITPDSKAFAGEFLQISGFKVKYNLSKPVGEKVIKLLIRCGNDCRVPKFEAVKDSEVYNVLTLGYLAKGGDLYSMLAKIEHVSLNLTISQQLIEYIRIHSPISTALDNRSQ
ncbi:hypothetical protein B4U80_02001, partial [Leptotrombidium deliense]